MEFKRIYEALNKEIDTETIHRKETDELGWERTDVLYSFRGLYTIGLHIYYGHLIKKTSNNFIYRMVNKKKERVYSNSWLIKNYNDKKFNDLNKLFDSRYLNISEEIGNVFPVWPGANSDRGISGACYDLPMIYFPKYPEVTNFFYNQKFILDFDKNLMKIYVDDNLSLEYILNMRKKDFGKFLNEICDNIEIRTKKINDELKSK